MPKKTYNKMYKPPVDQAVMDTTSIETPKKEFEEPKVEVKEYFGYIAGQTYKILICDMRIRIKPDELQTGVASKDSTVLCKSVVKVGNNLWMETDDGYILAKDSNKKYIG